MQNFGFPRPAAASIAAGLFVLAQTVAFAQNVTLRPPQAVVTKTEAFLPGSAQLVAPARVKKVVPHPQGRYALVAQNEADLPSASFIGESTTGGASLFLYDARLRKSRLLWERRADGGKHFLESIDWLPETDCAIVVTKDTLPHIENGVPMEADTSETATKIPPVRTVLFFDFAKSMVPRVLAVSPTVFIDASPTKPVFYMRDEGQMRMGSAPRGTFGPMLSVPLTTVYYRWNKAGTSVYGVQHGQTTAAPGSNPDSILQWYEWDGKTSSSFALPEQPTKAMFFTPVAPPVLPLALRTGTFSLPVSVALSPSPPQKALLPAPATTILHPLYLEALSDPTSSAAVNPYHSTLLTPDADQSFLLADESAILYEVGGAVYAIPLVRVKYSVYAQAQKAAALANAKQVGLAIRGYAQDYDEQFPPSEGFADIIGSYVKETAAVRGFSYIRPGSLAAVSSPGATIVGFIVAPGGRAIVYVDERVQWEAMP